MPVINADLSKRAFQKRRNQCEHKTRTSVLAQCGFPCFIIAADLQKAGEAGAQAPISRMGGKISWVHQKISGN
jgi:hypothetical protein